jgi:putative intracellular protease/amidase
VQHDGQVFTGQNPMSATAIGKAIAAALASA